MFQDSFDYYFTVYAIVIFALFLEVRLIRLFWKLKCLLLVLAVLAVPAAAYDSYSANNVSIIFTGWWITPTNESASADYNATINRTLDWGSEYYVLNFYHPNGTLYKYIAVIDNSSQAGSVPDIFFGVNKSYNQLLEGDTSIDSIVQVYVPGAWYGTVARCDYSLTACYLLAVDFVDIVFPSPTPTQTPTPTPLPNAQEQCLIDGNNISCAYSNGTFLGEGNETYNESSRFEGTENFTGGNLWGTGGNLTNIGTNVLGNISYTIQNVTERLDGYNFTNQTNILAIFVPPMLDMIPDELWLMIILIWCFELVLCIMGK